MAGGELDRIVDIVVAAFVVSMIAIGGIAIFLAWKDYAKMLHRREEERDKLTRER